MLGTFVVFAHPSFLHSPLTTLQTLDARLTTTIATLKRSSAVSRSPDDAMSTPAPLVGRLVPLRTKDEVRASLETHTVYVVEVPAKFANVVKE